MLLCFCSKKSLVESNFRSSPLSFSALKSEDSVTITSGVSMSYSSSTDDTSSLGTPSAIPQPSTETSGSDTLPPESPVASPVSGETEEEEKKDRLTEVPERSALLRTSMRSLSPFRRHSWGPGKNSAGEMEMSQRRYGSSTFRYFDISLLYEAITSPKSSVLTDQFFLDVVWPSFV